MQVLTPTEKNLIKRATEVQVNDLVNNLNEKHEEFIAYLEEYPEDSYLTIADEITSNIIMFEGLVEEPELVWKLGKHDLLVMQFIILKMIPEYGTFESRKRLYFKLQKTVQEINGISQN